MVKTVVITGTSRGIGYELVQLFVRAGYVVYSLSRKQDSIKALNLPQVHAISCDVARASSVASAAAEILERTKHIDIVIHNAGLLVNKPFETLTPDDFQRCYAVNVFGVAALTQALLPAMQHGSHAVAISSMGGVQGSSKFPGLAAYSSAKGAVITLFELLAEEYKEKGISFNTLALGAVQTEMLEEAFPGYQAPVTALQIATYIMDFAITGHTFYNGKVMQVSASTP